jgi:50S ribosomal subunit-associated GTPase HflX
VIRVLNKIDAVASDEWNQMKKDHDAMLVSAQTGEGLRALMIQIERHLFRETAQATLKP